MLGKTVRTGLLLLLICACGSLVGPGSTSETGDPDTDDGTPPTPPDCTTVEGNWRVETTLVKHYGSGSCGPNQCGWGAHPACGEITGAEVEVPQAGEISIRLDYQFIPGGATPGKNDPFVGTIDGDGNFTTAYEDGYGNGNFSNSTVIGHVLEDDACALEATFIWDPENGCQAEIQLTAEKQ